MSNLSYEATLQDGMTSPLSEIASAFRELRSTVVDASSQMATGFRDSISRVDNAANDASMAFDGLRGTYVPVMEALRSTAASTAQETTSAFSRIATSAGEMASDIRGRLSTAGEIMGTVGGAARRMGAQVAEAAMSAGGHVVNFAKGFLDLGSKLGMTIFGVQQFAQTAMSLGQALLGPNANLEQQTIAFTGLLHSGTKAREFLGELQQFAAATPFEFPDLVTAAQRMIAFGFSAQDVKPYLTAVGDAAAGLGVGAEQVNAMVYAMGQMHTAGVIHTQDLMQLATVGVPVYQILADGLHTNVQNVKAMIEHGKLLADQALPMLRDGLEKTFGGQMQNQSLTFNGLMSTLADNARLALMAFAGPLFERAKGALVNLGNLVSSPAFQQFAKDIGEKLGVALNAASKGAAILAPIIGQLGDWIMTKVVPAAIQFGTWFQANVVPILIQLGTVIMTQVMPGLANLGNIIFTQLIPAYQQLWTQVGPVLIPVLQLLGWLLQNLLFPAIGILIQGLSVLITVVAAVIGWFKQTGEHIQWLGTKAVEIFNGIKKTVTDALTAVGKFVIDKALEIKAKWDDFTTKIHTAIHDAFEKVKQTVTDAVNTVVGWFKYLYDHSKTIKDIVDFIVRQFNLARDGILFVWNYIKTWLTQQWAAIQLVASTVWNAITGEIQRELNQAKTIVTGWIDNVKGILSGIWSWISSTAQNAWHSITSSVSGMAGQTKDAVTTGVVSPVKSVIDGMKQWISDAGKALVKMLADAISGAKWLAKNAAEDVVNAIKNVLQWHSPTDEGPGSDSDTWADPLGPMLATSLRRQRDIVRSAAGEVAAAIQEGVTGFNSGLDVSLTGSSTGGRGLFGNGALLAASGGGSRQIIVQVNMPDNFSAGMRLLDDRIRDQLVDELSEGMAGAIGLQGRLPVGYTGA